MRIEVGTYLRTVQGCNEIFGSQGEWARSGEIEEIEDAGEAGRPDESYGRQLRAQE